MKKEKKAKKGFLVVEIVILSLLVASFIASIVIEALMPGEAFSVWVKENIWDIEKIGASFMSQIPVIIHSLIYIIVIYAVCKIVRLCLKKQMAKSNRKKTIVTLFDGLVKYGCAIALIILVLKACGVNTTALIASVGVLTLIIGLGAQSLIADIIAGIFIIFENEYNVGEIVSIDDFRGTVIEIGIRSTKLLDAAGNIKIINNSDVSNIVNMSRELSLAVVDLEFPYDVPLEFIEKMIKDNIEAWNEKIPGIVEGPFYKGVSYYAESNVAIKVVAKCLEEDRYQVQRDLLREYRQELVKHNIDISFNQVVVSQYEKTNIKVSNKDKKEIKEFVDEQREQSQGLEEQAK